MEREALKQQLSDERAAVLDYLSHPFTKQILEDGKQSEEAFLSLIVDKPVQDIPSLFAHFEAIGHLRGLRQSKAILHGKLEELETELEQLDDNK